MAIAHVLISAEENTQFFSTGLKSQVSQWALRSILCWVVEWLICEITGGKGALNAKYIKLKLF